MKLEKHIEATVCKHAESLGARQYKFSAEHDKGMPDRIFFYRHRAWFVEFKRPGGTLSPAQSARLRELEPHVPVYIVDTETEGKALGGEDHWRESLMEGTRAIVLKEPVGESYFYHTVYALQADRSGNEAEFTGGLVGPLSRTEYSIREDSLLERPTTAWTVIDDQDRELSIIDIIEKNSGPRARWLTLICERT